MFTIDRIKKFILNGDMLVSGLGDHSQDKIMAMKWTLPNLNHVIKEGRLVICKIPIVTQFLCIAIFVYGTKHRRGLDSLSQIYHH